MKYITDFEYLQNSNFFFLIVNWVKVKERTNKI